jgi:hypothetical protein
MHARTRLLLQNYRYSLGRGFVFLRLPEAGKWAGKSISSSTSVSIGIAAIRAYSRSTNREGSRLPCSNLEIKPG